jgi:hypothetical protein
VAGRANATSAIPVKAFGSKLIEVGGLHFLNRHAPLFQSPCIRDNIHLCRCGGRKEKSCTQDIDVEPPELGTSRNACWRCKFAPRFFPGEASDLCYCERSSRILQSPSRRSSASIVYEFRSLQKRIQGEYTLFYCAELVNP